MDALSVQTHAASMDESFWQARWRDGRIGFHQSQVHSQLQSFEPFQKLVAQRTAPVVLVPLCGKSLDLVWLAEQGFQVVGVEFVRSAIEAFFRAWGEHPTRGEYAGHPSWSAGAVTLVEADFFSFQAPEAFDAVYDRAALVAVKPQDRERYAQHLATLCRAEAALLLLSFVHDLNTGPPHSVQEQEIREIFEPYFQLSKLSTQNVLPGSTSLSARGAKQLLEEVWSATRLVA